MVPICLYCLNSTKFGQLILRNINKIVATRLKCIALAGLKGPTSKGREGRGKDGRGGDARGGEGMGGKQDHRAFPQLQICHYTTAAVPKLTRILFVFLLRELLID